MTYKRSRRRDAVITVKYAGKCSSCGGEIKAGEMARWDSTKRTISHPENLQGDSQSEPDRHDMDIEDDMARACGLM